MIEDDSISLEVIIVDDGSRDNSLSIAMSLDEKYPQVTVVAHKKNSGKGAALKTGFEKATGEFVAVQDADLEYSPKDLKKLVGPLLDGIADVVFGSRFLTGSPRRVLYFWHQIANAILTFLSNMFTDLNLTDMETCYKVFRREVIKGIELKEKRFGIEPEIVAKISNRRLRIYEMGISYYGRTYEEGKKIGIRDAFRALYCIFYYNSPHLPLPIQFAVYVGIGGLAAIINLSIFTYLFAILNNLSTAIIAAFISAALLNYLLCIAILFRHKARWSSVIELVIYFLVVALVGCLDYFTTVILYETGGVSPFNAKATACFVALIFNFVGRRFLVFPKKKLE
jgi:glycosyltransferase involved in cell wall biosynthesis